MDDIINNTADRKTKATLTCTLTYAGMLPLPLAVIILGRDVGLSLSAFYIRYASLSEPVSVVAMMYIYLTMTRKHSKGIGILAYHQLKSNQRILAR